MATMGLRRRVQPGSASSSSSSSSSSATSSSGTGKRSRGGGDSNNNLNAADQPVAKKTRASTRPQANNSNKSMKDLDLKKMANAGPPLWSDPRPYASIAGLSIEAQRALCAEGLPSPMYMSPAMATFVGSSLGKVAGPNAVSYLDISNMTTAARCWPPATAAQPTVPDEPVGSSSNNNTTTTTTATNATASTTSKDNNSASGACNRDSSSSSNSDANGGGDNVGVAATDKENKSETITEPSNVDVPSLPTSFPDDGMFAAYQPWVIKTYGDLAKTKTITIKKYARILRTLRGEEANSAENSKFRFWVKSKGFHIGQPEGYEPKPADRIAGRHSVNAPGVDPPLYVPTQPPHNKATNNSDSSASTGRIYKKVAIVENFFDIIHAVHVDLEGRPGKHAGQKRTYRTITETYAFLPREAVTRFLLGCTECQRRPRTPSPTSLAAVAAAAAAAAAAATTKPETIPSRTPTPVESPPSPRPATALSSGATPTPEDAKEASDPPVVNKTNSSGDGNEADGHSGAEVSTVTTVTGTTTLTTVTSTATTTTTTTTTTKNTQVNTEIGASCASDVSVSNNSTTISISSASRTPKNEKYNPLSITNLLRKDPIVSRRAPLLPLASKPEPTPLSCPPVTTTESCRSSSAQIGFRTADDCPTEEAKRCATLGYSAHGLMGRAGEDFSPAAGLIGQNLNLLATIQQLHCQVMLALAQRLRPACPSESEIVGLASSVSSTSSSSSSSSSTTTARNNDESWS